MADADRGLADAALAGDEQQAPIEQARSGRRQDENPEAIDVPRSLPSST